MAYNYEYPYVDPGLYNDDWLLKKMKELIAEWEAMQVKFNTLEEYVKNYFANLDITQEVNDKIDELLNSGELTQNLYKASKFGPFSFDRVMFFAGEGFYKSLTTAGSRLINSIAEYVRCGSYIFITGEDYGLTRAGSIGFEVAARLYFEEHPDDRISGYFICLNYDDYDDMSVMIATMTSLYNFLKSKGSNYGYCLPMLMPTLSVTQEQLTRYFSLVSLVPGGCYNISIPLTFNDTGVESLRSDGTLTPSGADIYLQKVLSAIYPDVSYIFLNEASYTGADGSQWKVRFLNLYYRHYLLVCAVYPSQANTSIALNIPFKSGACAAINANLDNARFVIDGEAPGVLRFATKTLTSNEQYIGTMAVTL